MLVVNGLGNLFLILGLSFVSAWAGMIVLAVALGRDVTNFIIYKAKSAPNKMRITGWDTASVIVFVVLTMSLTIPGVVSWVDSLTIIAGVIFTIAIWQKNILAFRISAIVVQILWFAYLMYLGNTSGTLMRAVLFGFNVLGVFAYFLFTNPTSRMASRRVKLPERRKIVGRVLK